MRFVSYESLVGVEVRPNSADGSFQPPGAALRNRKTVRYLSLILSLGLYPALSIAQQPPNRPGGQPPQGPTSPPPLVEQPPPPTPAPNYGTTPPEPFSIELSYWFTSGLPILKGGAADTATGPTGIAFTPPWHDSPGITISMPAGLGNSLSLSYFQSVGTGNQLAPNDLTVFGTSFSTGDYLVATHKLQNAKLSWDYLTWPTPLNDSSFRLRTLWEIQYTTAYSSIDGPFVPVTSNSSTGTTNSTTGYGTRWFIYPTLGLDVDKRFGHRFRLEAKASGFAIPHHATTWDATASGIVNIGPVDVIGAYREFHFKTSPQSDQYVVQTLSGAYVGLRWNFTGLTR
jgi:hypothetical protein